MTELKKGMAELLMAFVVLIVGLSLTPTIGSTVSTTATATGITGTAAATLIALVTIFWVILLVMIPIVVVYGMIEGF